jgi:hypothetical protein
MPEDVIETAPDFISIAISCSILTALTLEQAGATAERG